MAQHVSVVVGQPGEGSTPSEEVPPVILELAALGHHSIKANDTSELERKISAISGACIVTDERFIGHRHALRLALFDARYPAVHIPGVLRVEAAHRGLLIEVIREQGASGQPFDPDHLAAAMDDRVSVHRPKLGDLLAIVPQSAVEHEAAMTQLAVAGGDESIRLRQAVKSDDAFTATFLVSPYSRHIARWCARHSITPNQVTLLSTATALIGALAAATGSRTGYVLGAIALMGSFVLDCVDGQLARYTVRYSKIGAWLDLFMDRVKDYVFYAGLAYGSAVSGDPVWDLALVAMALQAIRHAVGDSYARLRPTARHTPGQGENTNLVARLSSRLNAFRWTVYLRRALTLPFGDKWLLMVVLVIFTTPRTVFISLIAATTVATCYVATSRILRTLRCRSTRQPNERRLAATADSAVLTLLFAGKRATRLASWRFSWLLPVVLRCLEYGTVLTLVLLIHAIGPLVAFCYLTCLALHHYKRIYQLKLFGCSSRRWPSSAAGGSDGRTALLLLLSLAGGDALRVVLPYLTTSLAYLFVITTVQFWLREKSNSRQATESQPVLAGATA